MFRRAFRDVNGARTPALSKKPPIQTKKHAARSETHACEKFYWVKKMTVLTQGAVYVLEKMVRIISHGTRQNGKTAMA